MVRAVDVGQRDDRIAERAGGAGRLAREHVEADADAALPHRLLERSVIDHFRARRVDEVRAGLQHVEDRRVDDPFRAGVQRQVDAEDVTARGDLLRRCGELHRHRLVGDLIPAAGKPAAPHDDRHAEGVRAPRHFLADVAVAEQPDRPAVEAARLRVFLLVPGAGAQVGDVVGHAAIEREHQREGELGDRDRILAGAVRDVDAALRRGGDVDRVVAGAGAHHERERSAFEHRPGHRRTAHHEDVSRRLAHGLHQRLVLQIRRVDDLAPGGLQPVDPALFKFVGNENFHIW